MHDIKALREDAAVFRAAWARKGLSVDVDALLALDVAERAAKTEGQEAQAARNALSKQIGQAKAKKDEAEAARLMGEVERLKGVIEAAAARETEAAKALFDQLAALPNRPGVDVPDGADEHGNVEVRRWYGQIGGDPPALDLTADHVTLGEALGMMDFEAAAKVSGARFVYLKADLARLERALAAFMLDLQTGEHGYLEVSPPLLVKFDAMFGTGQLPKFSMDLFPTDPRPPEWVERAASWLHWSVKTSVDVAEEANYSGREVKFFLDAAAQNAYGVFNLLNFELDEALESHIVRSKARHLIPTAEVSLTNYYRETILPEAEIATPIRLTADTPCFRAEAGSAGRDTRGMIRMHQFRKVELVSIARPEDSKAEHDRMTGCAEEVLKRLELPFRTMLLCAGDMGFSATKTYDLEVWLPSQGKYREISSCSNCGDFQARRMDARFKREGAKQTEFVHTLNGSGLAVGRTLVAILENYQNPDGSIAIPAALQSYMGGKTRIVRG